MNNNDQLRQLRLGARLGSQLGRVQCQSKNNIALLQQSLAMGMRWTHDLVACLQSPSVPSSSEQSMISLTVVAKTLSRCTCFCVVSD